MSGDIVLIGDNPQRHTQLVRLLGADGYCILPTKTVQEALLYVREPGFAASGVIFDVTLRRQEDSYALGQLAQRLPGVPLIMTAEMAAEMAAGGSLRKLSAMDTLGTLQVLPAPLSDPASYSRIREIMEAAALTAARSTRLQPEATFDEGRRTPSGPDDLLLDSVPFLTRVGAADVPVLLCGETGVGKEVMARRLWAYSPRAGKPFLKLNCAALPSELIESELFGYEKGAFTGATVDKPGKFEVAQNGTILLDEIGDMDIRLQAKLLQVLQDGEVQPLGSSRILKVNVRVMAATHRDLRELIKQGRFREDLYYRLNVISIAIPPLRERKHEILPLASTLLRRHLPAGTASPVITEGLKRALMDYSWPGNVRELENVMRRFLVYQNASMLIQELKQPEPTQAESVHTGSAHIGSTQTVSTPASPLASLNGAARSATSIDSLAEVSRQAENRLLLEALEATRWNRRQAALRLSIDYKAFLYKLHKHGIVEAKKSRDASA
jgi:two-component system response regulator AtoC